MKPKRFDQPRFHRQAGFSMVEMLVAIIVFSIGLIGVAVMQLKGMSYTKDAGSRTQATILARAMSDRMRMTMQEAFRVPVVGNVDWMEQLDYRFPGTAACLPLPCVGSLQTVVAADHTWLTTQSTAKLPAPPTGDRFTITRAAAPSQMHMLTLRWDEAGTAQQLAVEVYPM